MAELKTDPHENDKAPDGRPWRQVLAPYARPNVGRSVVDLLTAVVPYLALCVVMYQLLDVSYWLVLAVGVLASGFLLRTYILFHDCAHGSFLPTKRGNEMLGSVLAVIVYTPFASWRHSHAVHHATAGDLDRRGTGDVMTWTVAEYRSKPFAVPTRLPAVPQPARDVRHRSDLLDADPARAWSRSTCARASGAA